MNFKLLFILLFTSTLFSQKVTTSIDSTQKKIGSEFKLSLKTQINTNDKIVFQKTDVIGNLEVINSYKVDTVRKNNKLELTKVYGITQFDPGKYSIPKIPVVVNGKKIYSDSLNIEITEVKIDTLKQKMYDIKSITKTQSPSYWWVYLLVFLFLGIVGYFLYKYLSKNKTKTPIVEVDTRSAFERANAFLQQLDQKKLVEKGEIKTYYSELTYIAREYIEEELKIPAKESTTTQLIDLLRAVALQKKYTISEETFNHLEKLLQKADLVKFAKSKPEVNEIQLDKNIIQNTVVTLHKAIPVDDNGFNEAEQEKIRLQNIAKAKKQKQTKLIAISVVVLFLTLMTLLFTNIFTTLKDTVFGHPTKDLVEGDWIISEYGNPAIKIETPKVLKRTVNEQKGKAKQPKNAMQTFSYGSIFDHFYIIISTAKFDTAVDVDNPNTSLEPLAENIIREYEKQGAKNIIVKSEDFDIKKGLKGKKVYGTMSVPDTFSKEMVKLNYEVLIFAQYGGLQNIVIAYRENDTFGKQIVERIEKSIELMPTQ